MAKYLTQEWLDEYKRVANETQPERPGVSARMQYRVAGGPMGDVSYYWVIVDGALTEAQLGETPDTDFTITMAYDDAVKIQKGEVDTNAAFMQGKMKVTGNMAKLLSLLPLTNSPEFKKLEEEMRATNTYD
jgi:alkyl sulfatase BDS1-like metallo-beta-lactamase superfamily hydrolase